MSCLKCGFCCTRYKIILLTKKEAKEKLFKMRKHPDSHYIIFNQQVGCESWSNMVMKTKMAWVSMLGKIEEVCCYFDGMTNLCLTHSNKPYACRKFLCAKGKQEKE